VVGTAKIYVLNYLHGQMFVNWNTCTVIPRLTSDPANEFFG